MKKLNLAALLLALSLLASCAAPAVTETTTAAPMATAAETTPAAEPETTAAETETALSPERAYQCGADIVPEEPVGEVPPVTGLTLLGKDLSQYAVVLPDGADAETVQAADLLTEYVKKATGIVWDILAEAEADAEWLEDMDGLFAKAYDLAETEEQRAHVEKGSIQVKYFRLHYMGKMTDEKLTLSEELYNLMKKHGVTRLIESRELGEIINFSKGPSR